MNRYMIYCSEGSGGLFLTTVFAQALGYDIKANFSLTGHAHNTGQGNWKSTGPICITANHWDMSYRSNAVLYYTHQTPRGFLDQNPDVTLIKIVADPSDYRKIAELYVKKAWPDIWTKEEYNKWAGPDYPPYSPDNIQHSKIIQDDLINDFEITVVKAWHDKNITVDPQHTVSFKTVMGIGNQDLVTQVSTILKCSVPESTQAYIKEYQQLNQGLYFAG